MNSIMKRQKQKVHPERFSTTDRLFFENETKTNRMCADCMSVLILVTAAYGIFCVAGLENTEYEWTGWVIIASCMTELLFYLHIRLAGYDHPWSKYLVLTGLLSLSTVTFFLYPLCTAFIIFGPAMLSIKYYQPKFSLKVTWISWFAFLLAVAANMILDLKSAEVHGLHLEQGMLLWEDIDYVMPYYVIPRTAIYFLVGVISYRIARAGRQLVLDQAAVSSSAALMSAELNTAAKIQRVSLPDPRFRTPDGHMRLAAYVRTARDVGGDFYDYFMINDHLLVVTVADVSDKGLPSAMFAVEAQSYVRFAFSESFHKDVHGEIEFVNLEKALNAVNRQLSLHNMDGMFVTLWIGCFDTRTGVGKFLNAGHCLPWIRHADGTVTAVENEPQFFLGAFEDACMEAKPLRLRSGDTLLLYTDGATDARNTADETFGDERLKAAVEEAVTEKDLPERILRSVTGSIEKFIGEKAPYDDITLLALQFAATYHSRKLSREFETGEDCVSEVIDFVNTQLETFRCTPDFRRNLDVIIDEICDNISVYAYGGKTGPLTVGLHLGDNYAAMRFIDSGTPFNPLTADEPDTAGEPQIGGYGIYLVKNLADDVRYRYEDGKNILTVYSIVNM